MSTLTRNSMEVVHIGVGQEIFLKVQNVQYVEGDKYSSLLARFLVVCPMSFLASGIAVSGRGNQTSLVAKFFKTG